MPIIDSRKIVLIILLVISVSCRQKSTSGKSLNSINGDTVVETSKVSLREIKDTLRNFDVSNLPLNWIRLTETDSTYVIFESCDGGVKLLTINPQDSTILTHGQQEDSKYQISEARISNSGIIYFVIKGYSKNELFSLKWIDEHNQTALWTTVYSPSFEPIQELFILSDRQVEYHKAKQPCRECWGDEFCDEQEQKNKSWH